MSKKELLKAYSKITGIECEKTPDNWFVNRGSGV